MHGLKYKSNKLTQTSRNRRKTKWRDPNRAHAHNLHANSPNCPCLSLRPRQIPISMPIVSLYHFTSPPPTHPSGIGRGRRRNRTRQAWKIPTLAYELRTREIRFSCLELMFILGVDRFHERAGKISLDDGNLRAFLRFLESCN